MKLILAVMPTSLSEIVSRALLDDGYRVTKFASTASLLAGGTTTLMVGLQTAKVDGCLELIRSQVPQDNEADPENPRVTIYVLNIKDFAKV